MSVKASATTTKRTNSNAETKPPPIDRPYRCDDLLAGDPARWVFLADVDAKADVDCLVDDQSLVATCLPPRRLDVSPETFLRGRKVAVIGCDDDCGRDLAEESGKRILDFASEVRIVYPPGLEPRCLASWFAAGHKADHLVALVELSPPFKPPPRIFTADDEDDDDEDEQQVVDRWPKINDHAFHGVAGEIVRLADPHTEADPVATLAQFLIAFGNMIGRSPHFAVGPTRHHLNLFAVLVGRTAAGRKGTSWDVARWNVERYDQEWASNRIQGGLVSGEGLISHVRDERWEEQKVKAPKNGHANGKRGSQFNVAASNGREKVLVDPGVSDKRLLIVETEFSRMLKAMNRESNTLSDVVRQAWDSGNLRTLAKNNPVMATGSHVSMVAHTTEADVRRYLTETESNNGFANRFLWLAVRRSKSLPDGGEIDSVNWGPVRKRLEGVITQARACGKMRRDPGARKVWHAIYDELSAPKVGLVGAILSRAEAQTMRLACLYALLDGSDIVTAIHLTAATALWNYCELSARLIFGEAIGSSDGEKLLDALKGTTKGLTRKEVTALFGRHKTRAKVTALLSDFLTQGMIHRVTDNSTGGRPAERWFFGKGSSGGAH